MLGKFIITADRYRLRIYRYAKARGQFTPSIQPVDALDLREDVETPRADPAPPSAVGAVAAAAAPGEEMPEPGVMLARQATAQFSAKIASFLAEQPDATWDFAAPASMRDSVIELLPESVRSRLGQTVAKDLVQAPPAELREHFALK
ncbi:hypothetical protein DB347_02685 [Opitutaceae bacterium EW11]|nr:hypothetical protein DB347_02685 [Opitutaceae bacterium EW11]